jgi:hypothetical protein
MIGKCLFPLRLRYAVSPCDEEHAQGNVAHCE